MFLPHSRRHCRYGGLQPTRQLRRGIFHHQSSIGVACEPAIPRPCALHLRRSDSAPSPGSFAPVSMSVVEECPTAILLLLRTLPTDDDDERLPLSFVPPSRPSWPRCSFRRGMRGPWGRAMRTRSDEALGRADRMVVRGGGESGPAPLDGPPADVVVVG